MSLSLLFKFLSVVEEINGFYHDAKAGFRSVYNRILEAQSRSAKDYGLSTEYLDKVKFYYTLNDTEFKKNYKHRTTVFSVKERNAYGGINEQQTANYSIILIYQYWENYRSEIEKNTSIKLKSDLMADLMHFRNSIIHHRGFAYKKIKKCKILTWFKENDKIVIDEYKFNDIINKIKTEILNMVNKKYIA